MIDLTSGLDFKVDLRRMMWTKVAEAFGVPAPIFGLAASTVENNREGPSLSLAIVRDLIAQIRSHIVYYLTYDQMPDGQMMVLSGVQKICLIHPDYAPFFVAEVEGSGGLAIALDFTIPEHRQIWGQNLPCNPDRFRNIYAQELTDETLVPSS
ncbi:MAG: hypothetical protein AB7V39_07800 [Nitrospiraceae bacterium]